MTIRLHGSTLLLFDAVEFELDDLAVCDGLDLDAAAPDWIHVIPAEPFFHPRRGVINPTRDWRRQVVANHEAYRNDLVIDWEHQSMSPDRRRAPAAGWIDDLAVVDRGIDGHVKEWLEAGRSDVEGRLYRYLSPVIALNARDRRTGKPIGPFLVNVGLTNIPQIDALDALINGFRSTPGVPMFKNLIPFLAVLGVTLDDALQAKIETVTDDALPADLVEPLQATIDKATLAAQALVDRPAVPAEVATALGLKPDEADSTACCTVISALKAGSSDEEAIDLAEHTRVVGELAQARAELQVVKDRVAPASQALACRLFLRDEAEYKEMISAGHIPVVPGGSIAAPKPSGGGGTDPTQIPADVSGLTDAQLAVCSQLGIEPADYLTQLKAEAGASS